MTILPYLTAEERLEFLASVEAGKSKPPPSATGFNPSEYEQRAAFERGRDVLRGIFHSKLSRGDMEIRAAAVIRRTRDPAVRRALGDVVAAHLVRRGWPDATVASALSLASQQRIGRLPAWLDKNRVSAS